MATRLFALVLLIARGAAADAVTPAARADAGAADDPASVAARCEGSFAAARAKLANQWRGFREVTISRPRPSEIYAAIEVQAGIIYSANLRLGDHIRPPDAWQLDGISASRQLAAGFAIIGLGAAHPFAPIPKAALKRFGAFVAAFRDAVDRCTAGAL